MSGNLRNYFENLRLAVLGYKTGHPPAWLHLERVSLRLAGTEEDDDRAVASLRDEVQRSPVTAVQRARERITERVYCYETDRATRLIDAATDGSPLRPVDARWADLFAREARIGGKPPHHVFTEIVSSPPEIGRIGRRFGENLLDVRRTAKGSDEACRSIHRPLLECQRGVGQGIGSESQTPD